MDLSRLLRTQDQLLTRAQALEHLTASALRHRLRPGGPWKVVLPAVYAAFTGALTPQQCERAALLHAGPQSQLAGRTATLRHGLRSLAYDGQVHVLVPHDRQPSSVAFVAVRRTHRLPEPVRVRGLPTVPLARAVVDAGRTLRTLREVRALVAEPVQARRLRVEDLADELAAGHSAGSLLVRRALAEVGAGVRSATEAELRVLFLRSPLLRHAVWNARLVDQHGRWLADVDAYLEDAGLAVESDSKAWHLSPEDWEQTMARSARLAGAGVQVVHVPPQRHRRTPELVVAEVEQAYLAARRTGPPPGIRVLRPAS